MATVIPVEGVGTVSEVFARSASSTSTLQIFSSTTKVFELYAFSASERVGAVESQPSLAVTAEKIGGDMT